MTRERLLHILSRRARIVETLAAAALVLLWIHLMGSWLGGAAEARRRDSPALSDSLERLSTALAEHRALHSLKARDASQMRSAVTNLAKHRRSLYESGLSLQEEKRLLEKQLDIMTTYLHLDEGNRRVSVMRGEQAYQTMPFGYPIARLFGSAMPIPPLTQIVSKERFAHPERGKAEEVDGQLVWNPPQVGTSVRANALGEYVMFTTSFLVLHGPPKKPEEHEAFPHACLGLPLATARALYKASYIGTRVVTVPAGAPQDGGAPWRDPALAPEKR